MSCSSTATQKRRRTESDAQNDSVASTATSAARTKDPEFWFEDGNVILVAHNYEFRVFKGVLAHHSSVFRDMFSLSPPISAAPVESSAVADACLVVHLSDSPEDLRHVLRTYLPGINSRFMPLTESQQNPSFDEVSALIRLGHKYQMQALVAQGVQYLKRWFTDDLRTWSAGKFYASDCPIQKKHAIGVVNLARLVSEPSLLPTALLICCALDRDIVRGYTREDGTQETLTLADIGRCFAARAFLARGTLALAAQIFRLVVRGADVCAAPLECEQALQQMLLDVAANMEYFARLDVFTPWPERYEDGAGPTRVRCCASCRELLQRRDMEERLKLWMRLPRIMEVRVDYWSNRVA